MGFNYTSLGQPTKGRRWLFAVLAIVLCGLAIHLLWIAPSGRSFTQIWRNGDIVLPPNVSELCGDRHPPPLVEDFSHPSLPPLDISDWTTFLKGPPTDSFRENLRDDVKYITSWAGGGFTNDVITIGNMLYLSLVTGRVPIVSTFTPSRLHMADAQDGIAFGDVFDLPRLRTAMQTPVLEWPAVKRIQSEHFDNLGCWAIWAGVQLDGAAGPWEADTPTTMKIDASYKKAPGWTKLPHDDWVTGKDVTYWSLASLAAPSVRASVDTRIWPSRKNEAKLEPEDHLLCYDLLYFVDASEAFEVQGLDNYSPMWTFVGQYMYWTEHLTGLADKHVRRTLAVPDSEPTPPWIAIHARRDDFGDACGDVPLEDCYPSFSVFERRVKEVQDEIREKKGLDVQHIFMTSDERDKAWWDGVSAMGWKRVEWGEGTRGEEDERYGSWFPLLVDAVIQSTAQGMIGTARSTMSVMAQRRARSWEGAAVRTVEWGRPGADDH